ncbi:MAG: glycosyltransferase family 2 protein [Mycobacteriaceae bacterium]
MSHSHKGRTVGARLRSDGDSADGTRLVRPVVESVEQARRPTMLPVTVVIPTWNEGANIGHVLELMPDVEQLVIVDANSDDGTVDVVLQHRPNAVVVQQKPGGKGTAMRAGFEVATAEYIVSMDGNGSMDPGEVPSYVALLQQGYDVVKGSRGAVGGSSTDPTSLRRVGNWGLTSLYNAVFGSRLSDLCYGFIGFRRDRLAALGLYAKGREIEVQILAHAELAGLSVAQIPSREVDRLDNESHPSAFRDGRRVLRSILRARVQPGREWWRHVGSGVPEYDVLEARRARDEPAGSAGSEPVRESEPAPEAMPRARRHGIGTPVIPQQRRA